MSYRALILLSAGALMAQPAVEPRQTARTALDLLLAQKYTGLIQMLSPEAQKSPAYSEQALAKGGAEMQPWGKVESIGDPAVRKLPGATLVFFPVKFATQNITFGMTVSDDGKITGFSRSAPDPWQHPSYSKPDTLKERAVTIGDAPYKLPGTLTVPAGGGPFPAAVLVHDSGAGDRDEVVGSVKVFKDLAEGLASRGIMVLRYDKRTRVYPAVTKSNDYTVEKETMEDAGKALALLRAQPETKAGKVFLIGYGLGGYVAPRIAEADGKLAGMVLLNAYARPLEDVALDQATAIGVTGAQLSVIKEQAAKIKKLSPADEDTPPLIGMLGPYILDLQGYNPAGQAKLLGNAMLILQGERDFQASMKDFTLWKSGLAGMKGLTMKSYPTLDHVLAAGSGPSHEADYKKPGQHIAADIVDDVAKWIAGQ